MQEHQNRQRRRKLLISIVLASVTLGIFLPVLRHDFLLYDDQQYVTENTHIQRGLTWPNVTWALSTFYASNWHPLTWLSHMLDVQLYGLHPWGHHLTNVLLHAGNSVLLFLVLNRMTRAVRPSAMVAALFAWHPLHVESVAWVAERKDVLSACFWLLTLYVYALYVAERRSSKARLLYLSALLLFGLGLMSKPMVVTLPCVLLLVDFWPLARFRLTLADKKIVGGLLLEKLPFAVLAAWACALTVLAQSHSYSIVSMASLPLWQRSIHAVAAYGHYLGATIVPRHLAVYYPYEVAINWWLIGAAAIALATITLAAAKYVGRAPYLFVGWFWFLGTLVPVIGLVQVGDQAWADRYSYLPLIGLFIAVVWGLSDLLNAGGFGAFKASQQERRGTSFIAVSMATAIGLLLLAVTSVQLRYWKNTRTLFERAAKVTRNNSKAFALLGSLMAHEGRLDEAISSYRTALAFNPNDPEAHFFLGNAFERQGNLAEAIAEYNQVLWFKPLQEKAHLALGVVLAKRNEYEAAAAQYREALKLNPESAIAQNNLARVLHSQGKLDEAIEHYSAALRLDPNLAAAHNNLAVLQLQKGQIDLGAAELRLALKLRPDDPETQYNLAMALNQQERWNEAADLFSRLGSSRQDDPKFHFQFGLALAHERKTKEAMSHYARALLLQPDYPEALDRLSWILATDPNPELRNGTEAVRMASSACELTSNKRPEMLLTLAAALAEEGRYSEAQIAAQRAGALASDLRRQDIARKCDSVSEVLRMDQPWRE